MVHIPLPLYLSITLVPCLASTFYYIRKDPSGTHRDLSLPLPPINQPTLYTIQASIHDIYILKIGSAQTLVPSEMSEGSRALSLAPSTSSGSSIGSPEWTCSECQADGAAVELVEYEGNMVCPQCARIDAVASSARGHVNINDISGQIVDRTQSLQSLEKSWNDRSTWHDRGFMVSQVDSL
jgi:hypothetical protein